MQVKHREPSFWMYEQSGILPPVIQAYLHAENLTPKQIAIMRDYLRQWIDATAWDENPGHTKKSRKRLWELRERAAGIITQDDISRCVFAMVSEGMDPL